MRVIGADGAQIGVIPTHEALKLAEEAGLELVEVNPRAAPPVCKIMDFGKFKYETSKKEKASRKHQSTIVLKEIKLRPKTDEHDFDFKVKHIRRFLAEGNKCKLVIVFRGREIVHPETGQAMLDSGGQGGQRHRDGRAAPDDGRAPHGHDHRPARRRHSRPLRRSPVRARARAGPAPSRPPTAPSAPPSSAAPGQRRAARQRSAPQRRTAERRRGARQAPPPRRRAAAPAQAAGSKA